MKRARSVSVVISLIILVGSVPAATALDLRLTRYDADAMNAVALGPDGSVYVAAQQRAGSYPAAALIRYTPAGERIWTRTFRPNIRYVGTRGEVVDVAENGVIVWGGELHGGCEGGGWFLEWRTPGGRLLHRYRTPDWRCGRAERIRDIAVHGGQVVVAGYSHGCCSDPFADGWVRAFGMDGLPRWEADIEPPAGTPRQWFDRATGVAIGAFGNVYVGGWAATEYIRSDYPGPGEGTPILAKLTSGGGLLWSRRIPARMNSWSLPTTVAARGDRVMVSAPIGGRVLWFGAPAPAGWLGAFDTGGDLRWQVRWDDQGRDGAVPEQISIDASGATWVVGTRRDVADRTLQAFVRRFGPGGAPEGFLRLGAPRNLVGTSIVATAGGAIATGNRGLDVWGGHGGRLWKVAI